MGTQIMKGEVLHPQKIEFGVCFLFTPPKALFPCVWALRNYCTGDICCFFMSETSMCSISISVQLNVRQSWLSCEMFVLSTENNKGIVDNQDF